MEKRCDGRAEFFALPTPLPRPARLSSTIPMKRPGTADEIATGVLWLLSPEASYVTGTILEIGGAGDSP